MLCDGEVPVRILHYESFLRAMALPEYSRSINGCEQTLIAAEYTVKLRMRIGQLSSP